MDPSTQSATEDTLPTRLAGGFALRHQDGELFVDCPFPPPGWQARQPGDFIRPDFPGTPLLHNDQYFEIIAAEEHGGRVRYALEPWDDRNLLRAPQSLDAPSCRTLWRTEQARRERERRAQSLRILMPLTGLLPAKDQEGIEREYGLLSERATLISAGLGMLFFLPTAFFGLMANIVSGFTSAFPGFAWTGTWFPFLGYFAIESWVRAHMSFSSGQAIGSLPVVLVVETVRTLRNLRS